MEECHPLLFDVDLENPNELPCDWSIILKCKQSE
jgi:hypothetical protein